MEGVDAVLLEPARDLDRVVEGVALGEPGLERVMVVGAADLGLEVIVAPHLLADGARHAAEQAGAVLERAAVLVLAIVDRRAEKLGEQVTVARVQLDAVAAGGLGPPGARDELVDDGVDLGDATSPSRGCR